MSISSLNANTVVPSLVNNETSAKETSADEAKKKEELKKQEALQVAQEPVNAEVAEVAAEPLPDNAVQV